MNLCRYSSVYAVRRPNRLLSLHAEMRLLVMSGNWTKQELEADYLSDKHKLNDWSRLGRCRFVNVGEFQMACAGSRLIMHQAVCRRRFVSSSALRHAAQSITAVRLQQESRRLAALCVQVVKPSIKSTGGKTNQ